MTEPAAKANELERAGPPLRRRSHRWLLALLGVLILVCGIVIGAGAMLIVGPRIVMHTIQHPEHASERFAAKVKRDLRLSEQQTRAVRAIFDKRMGKVEEIVREAHSRVAEQFEQMEQEIAGILDENQVRTWHDWCRRHRPVLLGPRRPKQESTDEPSTNTAVSKERAL